MARTQTADELDNLSDVGAEATEGAEENGSGTDGRYILIQDPETGEQIKRVDWIRKVFQQEGGKYYGDRGAIAKALTEIQGKKVPYQIVFAATKDLKHIRKPEAEAEAEAEVEV
jgi:hypothetical protein